MASLWIIGDIHGQGNLLTNLLATLPRGTDDVTVFLGDYIDRGWQTAEVVSRVMAEYDAAPDRTVLLWGNHEDLAAQHFGKPCPTGIDYDSMSWFHNGGVETMATYGWDMTEMIDAPCPPDLLRLFSLLRIYYRPPSDRFPELSNVVCVHAGLMPGDRPEESENDVMLWVRDEFLNVIDRSGRLVIHGHTPIEDVQPQPDKIGIDTGAAYGGPLTAIQLPERRIYQSHPGDGITEGPLPPVSDTAPERLHHRKS